MELISTDRREVVLDVLCQIKESIENLMTWNQGITDMNQLLLSAGGTSPCRQLYDHHGRRGRFQED